MRFPLPVAEGVICHDDTTESQKKTCFNAHFQYSQSKITGLNKMWTLISWASLHGEVVLELVGLVYMQYNISDS